MYFPGVEVISERCLHTDLGAFTLVANVAIFVKCKKD